MMLWLFLVLLVAVVFLGIDAHRQRTYVATLHTAVAALQRQAIRQDAAIATYDRALSLLVPPDTRPTAPHGPRPVDRGRTRLAAVPSPPPAPEPPPSGATASLPPVDIEGDRSALPPESGGGDAGSLPSGRIEDDDEPEEEKTHAYRRPLRRPTLLGGLAGAPLESPRSSATRTAAAWEAAHPGDTLVSVAPPPASDARRRGGT